MNTKFVKIRQLRVNLAHILSYGPVTTRVGVGNEYYIRFFPAMGKDEWDVTFPTEELRDDALAALDKCAETASDCSLDE